MSDITRDFEKVQKLIRKVSLQFVNRLGVDVEDVYQEGCLAFVEAYPKYSPERGALTTFTYCVVLNRIKRVFLRKQKISINLEESMELYCSVMEIPVDTITEDARCVLQVVETMEADKMRGASIRRSTRDYLRSEGWPVNRIEKAFNQIRETVLN